MGDFIPIIAGMTGAQLIQALNTNSALTKTIAETLAANILLRVAGNNVKQVKVEGGKFYYTIDDTNWIQVDNNVWGSITGSIADQTDLIELLEGKAGTDDVEEVNNRVDNLSNTVGGLSTTVSNQGTIISGHTSAIGDIQAKQSKQVSSEAIVALRIGSSGFLQYSLDGVTWLNVQSVADINWGAIGGEISNQVDLKQILDSKISASQLTAHTGNKDNPHEVTKAQVGLDKVDNTSDADKPISTAQQIVNEALNQYLQDLNTDKMPKTEEVEALEYISLDDWNEKRQEGTLSDKTIYIVD